MADTELPGAVRQGFLGTGVDAQDRVQFRDGHDVQDVLRWHRHPQLSAAGGGPLVREHQRTQAHAVAEPGGRHVGNHDGRTRGQRGIQPLADLPGACHVDLAGQRDHDRRGVSRGQGRSSNPGYDWRAPPRRQRGRSGRDPRPRQPGGPRARRLTTQARGPLRGGSAVARGAQGPRATSHRRGLTGSREVQCQGLLPRSVWPGPAIMAESSGSEVARSTILSHSAWRRYLRIAPEGCSAEWSLTSRSSPGGPKPGAVLWKSGACSTIE
jgi:hypothetical protein